MLTNSIDGKYLLQQKLTNNDKKVCRVIMATEALFQHSSIVFINRKSNCVRKQLFLPKSIDHFHHRGWLHEES